LQTEVTAPAESSLAAGDSAGLGNSQHASEAPSYTAAIIQPVQPTAALGLGGSVDRLDSGSASAIETSIDLSNGAGPGTLQHLPQSAGENALDSIRPAVAASGDNDQKLTFHFDSQATASAPAPVVGFKATNDPLDPPGLLGPEAELGAIPQVGPHALEEHAVGHDDNAQHHSTVPPPHDFLI
jgi:hypothetical protein